MNVSIFVSVQSLPRTKVQLYIKTAFAKIKRICFLTHLRQTYDRTDAWGISERFSPAEVVKQNSPAAAQRLSLFLTVTRRMLPHTPPRCLTEDQQRDNQGLHQLRCPRTPWIVRGGE